MKWIKRIGLLFVAIVLVAVLAIVAFALTFDPNDYKPQIAAQVEKETGRSVQFNGDLSVTIFPWLGAATEDVVLANAEGFEPEHMVSVKRLEAQAALLPLLRGEFEIGTLLLEEAEIHLTRREDGHNNWEDLAERSAEAPDDGSDKVEPEGGEGPAMALTVGGVDVRDATLHWRDEQAGQEMTIDGLDLSTGELADGEPTDVELVSGFRLAMPGMPPVSGSVDLSSRARVWLDRQEMLFEGLELNVVTSQEEGNTDAGLPERIEALLRVERADVRAGESQLRLDGVVLDLDGKTVGPLSYLESRIETVLEADWSTGRYDLSRLAIEADLKGLPNVGETVRVAANAAVSADLEAGTASIDDLRLFSDPVEATGRLDIAGLDGGEPVVSGPIEIAAFDPRGLADRLGMTVPEMRSDEALREFALAGRLDASSSRAMLDDLRVSLDGSELTGRAGIDDLESGRLFARLEGGDVDVNPYLAPKVEGQEDDERGASSGGGGDQSSAAANKAEIDLPVEALRGLELDARLQLAGLRYEDYRLTSPIVHVTASGGRVQLAELAANAFDGSLDASGALDVRGEVPSYAGKARVEGVSLQPLLTAVMDEDRLLGRGDVSFDLSTQGKRVDQLESGLDGTADFALRDGKVKGFDVGYLLRRAQARLEGRTEPEPEELSTDFTSITGTATVRNGVVSNDDLAGASPLLRVAGKGDVDLPREEIDYRLTATVVNTATGQGGEDLERLKQVPVPIRIKGAFSDPSISLDLESLAKEAAKGEAKKRIEEEVDKRLKDEGGEKVKELLKGFGL